MTERSKLQNRVLTERSVRWLIIGLGLVGVLLAAGLFVAYWG